MKHDRIETRSVSINTIRLIKVQTFFFKTWHVGENMPCRWESHSEDFKRSGNPKSLIYRLFRIFNQLNQYNQFNQRSDILLQDIACWGKHAMSMGKPLRGFQAKRKSEESNFPAGKGKTYSGFLQPDFSINTISLIKGQTFFFKTSHVGENMPCRNQHLPKALSPSEG
jgi:hypothetical protein